MTLRDYTTEDKEQCLAVFRSNCPLYFDESEYLLFAQWLDHQGNSEMGYQSPTYANTVQDCYYVVELPEIGIVGCGGFYIQNEPQEARLAWGMIHSSFHKQGYGTHLYKHRYHAIQLHWPNHQLTLGTSQHTFAFYEKMGFTVVDTIPSGYGEDLDRYDMKTN